ncbi:hypothetical protein HMI55_002129 [Coelomomyces lativittatus]|nr:hypothetical protein HMI55_002129 [Coelomomyces lativittatus]
MTHNVPCSTPHFPSPAIGPTVIDPPVVLPTKPPPPTSTSPPPLRSSLIGTTSKPHATPMLRNSFTKPRLSKAPLYKMKSSFMHSRRPALKFQTIEEENEFRHLTNAHPSNSLIKSNVEL